MRVFLHTETVLTDQPFPSSLDLDTFDSDYGALWKFLKGVDVLKGKRFPEQSKPAAWAAASDDYENGSVGVVLAGSLKFNNGKTGPFYNFRLKPLKLDQTHRLGRRLGHNRFLELDMPGLLEDDLTNIVPVKLKTSTQKGMWDWFWADAGHAFLGYIWKPFFRRDIEQKPPKRNTQQPTKTQDVRRLHRVHFFAVTGRDLQGVDDPLEEVAETQRSLEISISTLLEMIRSTEENKHEPALKLFSRTALGKLNMDSSF